MPLHPSLSLIFSALLGIAMSCLVIIVGVLWARVRSLPVEETNRLVDDLSRRQDTIEGLLSQLDGGQGPEKARAGASSSAATATKTATASSGPEAGESRPPHRIDPAATNAVGGPTLIAVPSLSASVAETSAEAAAELGRRFGAIWALADAGEPAEAIARTIGQPIGQVELILGLRRQLSQSSQPGGRA
jgi:hypothetical protein